MAQVERQRRHGSGVKTRYRVLPPQQYEVVFHNDDVTTMDFVVYVLEPVFNKLRAEALSLMLKVHHEGSAVVGIYSRDIAQSKTDKALRMARAAGFPLRITIRPENSPF